MKNTLFGGCARLQVPCQSLRLFRAACRPTEEELANFGRPDFTIYNAGRGRVMMAARCLGCCTGSGGSSPPQFHHCKHILCQPAPAACPDAPSMCCRSSCCSIHPPLRCVPRQPLHELHDERDVCGRVLLQAGSGEHSIALGVSLGSKDRRRHGVPASPPPEAAHAMPVLASARPSS